MKRYSLILIFISFIFISCNKSEDEVTGVGDAFIITRIIDGDTLYGLSLQAYSLSSFSQVTVAGPSYSSSNYQLKPYYNNKNNFYYESADDDYVELIPETGTYTFSGTFENGVTEDFYDELTSDVLAPPSISNCEYNTEDGTVEISWDDQSGQDFYLIELFSDENLVFISNQLQDDIDNYTFNENGSGWINYFVPTDGDVYKVIILAFMYEPDGDSFNIQAASSVEYNITWGD